ncbi:3-oxoacyl-[acyl-carrier-protein] reductase FabG [Dirofilaria immitis]
MVLSQKNSSIANISNLLTLFSNKCQAGFKSAAKMCIAKTTTTVAHRSLYNKLPVKQLVVPLRSKCTTFIEEPMYRPRFRKHDWEQSSLWRKIFGRMHDAWQMSYIGKRFAVSLALAWALTPSLARRKNLKKKMTKQWMLKWWFVAAYHNDIC